MKKKLNKSFFENLENRKQIRTCDEKDCLEPGYFQAPKSPDGKGWYYFCSNHIKKHKKNSEPKKNNSRLEKALKIFSLNNDFNEIKLKKRYKELVKKYHPDLNKNFLNKDNKIKEINKAYNILLETIKKT